jgi:hypothetical protein
MARGKKGKRWTHLADRKHKCPPSPPSEDFGDLEYSEEVSFECDRSAAPASPVASSEDSDYSMGLYVVARDHHRDELRASQTEVSQLNKLLSSKDSIIKELRALKKLVSRELEIARHDIKALDDDHGIMKAMCDKSMDKAVRAGRILMKRPGVVVPEDIVADVLAASSGVSKPSSSSDPAGKVPCKNAPAQ